jgi:hypothetical protein
MPIPVTAVNRLVQDEGERVRHFVGLRCPCHGGNADGQPDPNCVLHELGGWFYPEEANIVGLVTSISEHRDWIEAGVALPGDSVFSPLTQDTVSEGDKIVFTWPIPFGQGDPLLRGAGDTETLYYPPARGIYCIDENRVKYAEGTDYRLTDRTIEWAWMGKPAEGKKPALGIKYTIKYMALIEWIAMDPPSTRISAGNDIGSKVLLRKKHLFEQ